jgi:hypothetical protein
MQIEIPEALFARLQKHATPLVDTPSSVIERWADFYEEQNTRSISLANSNISDSKHSVGDNPQPMRQLSAERPPSLLHTRVRGQFGAIPFSNWNDLVRIAHVQAFKEKAQCFDALRKVTRAQIKEGRYSSEGYHHVPEIGVSIQGVDADRAWEYALRLAIYLKTPLQAEVEWRHNDKAAHPGECAVISWNP